MGTTVAELVAAVRSEGFKKVYNDLQELGRKGDEAQRKLDKSTNALGAFTKKVATYAAGLYSVNKALNVVISSSMAAARYETLGVVLDTVGRNAGYSSEQVRKLSEEVQGMGITMTEARNTVIRMIQADMDLSKATKLARLAQDAAVVGNINSSAALNRLIYAVQTAQPEMLRLLGLNVSFEASYRKMAKELGKAQNALTEQEKMQARLNAVMEKGDAIAGAYVNAMQTAGKQMTSLPRYIADLRIKFGELFSETTKAAVFGLAEVLKDLNKQFDELKKSGDIARWSQNIAEIAVTLADGLRLAGKIALAMADSVKYGFDVITASFDNLFESFVVTKKWYEAFDRGDITLWEWITADNEEARAKLISMGVQIDATAMSLEELAQKGVELQETWAKTFDDPTKVRDWFDELQRTVRISAEAMTTATAGKLKAVSGEPLISKIVFGSKEDAEWFKAQQQEYMDLMGELTGEIQKAEEAAKATTTPKQERAVASNVAQTEADNHAFLLQLRRSFYSEAERAQIEYNNTVMRLQDLYAEGRIETEEELNQYLIEAARIRDEAILGQSLEQQLRAKDLMLQLRREQYTVAEQSAIEFNQRMMEIENLYMLGMFDTEEEYRKARELAELKHQARLGDIIAKAKLQRMQFEKKTNFQQKKEIFAFLAETTAGVAQHNRALFEINKMAAIANAVINVSEGITKAWSFGPVLGPAMAALVAAAGAVQISTIMSTSFGSGAAPSVSAGARGGVGAPVNTVPVASAAPEVPSPADARQTPEITIVFDGDVYGWDDYIENRVVTGIREALDRDVRLN